MKIADGIDGSGCHQIYNQYEINPTPSIKTFLLFAFKFLSIHDSTSSQVWINNSANSSYGVRPIVLLAQKECLASVQHIMHNIINPEVTCIEQEGLQFPQGHVQTNVYRSMIDCKMFAILSGAGGAPCQLCTASKEDFRDLELVRAGYPINRTVSDAIEHFTFVDKDEFLNLTSTKKIRHYS